MIPAAVWIVVMHFSVSWLGQTYAGRVLPDGPQYRRAWLTKAECDLTIPPLQREFAGKAVAPQLIACEKLELRK